MMKPRPKWLREAANTIVYAAARQSLKEIAEQVQDLCFKRLMDASPILNPDRPGPCQCASCTFDYSRLLSRCPACKGAGMVMKHRPNGSSFPNGCYPCGGTGVRGHKNPYDQEKLMTLDSEARWKP